MMEPEKINKQIEKSEKIGASIFDTYSDVGPHNDTSTVNKNDLYRGFYYDHNLCGNSPFFRKPKNIIGEKSMNDSKMSALRMEEDLGITENNPLAPFVGANTSNQDFMKSS